MNVQGIGIRLPLTWRLKAIGGIVMAAIVLLLCPWLWQGMVDGYVSYSGVVVDKGIEHHLLAVRGDQRYIILLDQHGNKTKRYVDHYGYAFTHIGTFVVKKRGFGEYPRRPGERTPGELMHDLEKAKERLQQKPPPN